MKAFCCAMILASATARRGHESFADLVKSGKKELGKVNRIIGGVPAEFGRYPWFTAIGVEYCEYFSCDEDSPFMYGFCGASFIAPDLLLTAAHCVFEDNGRTPSIAQVGAFYATDNAENGATADDVVRIVEWFTHPDYDESTYANDVAILRIETPVSGITPLKLMTESVDDVSNSPVVQTLTVIGLGTESTQTGGTPSQLMEVDVSYVDETTCQNVYDEDFDGDSMFCAADPGQDSCGGDSGGPMFVTYGNNDVDVQVGIVSWGFGCAIGGFPGVYADIGGVKDFIDSILESQGVEDVFISFFDLVDTPTTPPSPTPAPVPTPEPTNVPGIPNGWTCIIEYYASFDGCDCQCGIYDPDCDDPFEPIFNCQSGAIGCSQDAQCIYEEISAPTTEPTAVPVIPDGWTCLPEYFATFDGCDCQCGVYDPDCDDPFEPIFNCDSGAVRCSEDAQCIYEESTAPTTEPTTGTDIPDEWNCSLSFYDTEDGCDCQCGAYDPDCNIPGQGLYNCLENATGCSEDAQCLYGPTTAPTPRVIPDEWTCLDNYYDTLDGCDCECGAFDPDCDVPGQNLLNCPEGASGCSADSQCTYDITLSPQSSTSSPTVDSTTAEPTVSENTTDGGINVEFPLTNALVIALLVIVILLAAIFAILLVRRQRTSRNVETTEVKASKNPALFADEGEAQILA